MTIFDLVWRERLIAAWSVRRKYKTDSHARCYEFEVGDRVYAKNYGYGNSWLPGKVTSKLGSTMYRVLLNDGRSVHKYVDQIRSQMENKQFDSSLRDTLTLMIQ